LEAGGGGGGNGDDVLAARWAQRRRRRVLGRSGALPWFDGALAALTAVLAERWSSQAALPDRPTPLSIYLFGCILLFSPFLSFIFMYLYFVIP
jgi:hypothetical protein